MEKGWREGRFEGGGGDQEGRVAAAPPCSTGPGQKRRARLRGWRRRRPRWRGRFPAAASSGGELGELLQFSTTGARRRERMRSRAPTPASPRVNMWFTSAFLSFVCVWLVASRDRWWCARPRKVWPGPGVTLRDRGLAFIPLSSLLSYQASQHWAGLAMLAMLAAAGFKEPTSRTRTSPYV